MRLLGILFLIISGNNVFAFSSFTLTIPGNSFEVSAHTGANSKIVSEVDREIIFSNGQVVSDRMAPMPLRPSDVAENLKSYCILSGSLWYQNSATDLTGPLTLPDIQVLRAGSGNINIFGDANSQNQREGTYTMVGVIVHRIQPLGKMVVYQYGTHGPLEFNGRIGCVQEGKLSDLEADVVAGKLSDDAILKAALGNYINM